MSRMRRAQTGLSTLELLVGLIISAIVLALFGVAYKSLTKGDQNLKSVTDIQREVKSMTRELESDLRRAGFGLTGVEIFPILKPNEIRFLYRDLVGTYCPTNDTTAITYTAGHGALTKTMSCNGADRPAKVVHVDPDSLNMAFRYLDATGNPTSVSGNIQTVEFTVEVVSSPSSKHAGKTRMARGSVGVVNNI